MVILRFRKVRTEGRREGVRRERKGVTKEGWMRREVVKVRGEGKGGG